MIRLSIAIICFILTGCSGQLTYDCAIYIVNPCPVMLSVTAKNYTGSIASLDGKDPEVFSLFPKERRVIAVFSLANLKQDFSGHFNSDGEDFVVSVSDGHNKKILKGSEVFEILQNVTTERNLKTRNVVYEINDGSLCQQ